MPHSAADSTLPSSRSPQVWEPPADTLVNRVDPDSAHAAGARSKMVSRAGGESRRRPARERELLGSVISI